MPHPFRLSGIAAALLGAALFVLGACDNKNVNDIRAMLVMYDTANNSSNGGLAKLCVTKSSNQQYDQIRRHALYSDEKTVRALRPFIKHEVLMARNRASAEQLEVLTGEDFLVWSTNEGWYATGEAGWSEAFGAIKVNGTVAYGEVLEGGKPTGERVTFLLEDGRWRLDETTGLESADRSYVQLARAEGVPIDDLLILIEAEDSGKEVSEKIWQPMIRR